MTPFVRALDTYQDGKSAFNNTTGRSSKGLTKHEISLDIFVINFAGHDSTANPLTFAMIQFAANPNV